MMFNERIKHLREDRQMTQRKLAVALDIDTASYCKIERGERRVCKIDGTEIHDLNKITANNIAILFQDFYNNQPIYYQTRRTKDENTKQEDIDRIISDIETKYASKN